MSNYSEQWSSAKPGMLIILLDQSGSMSVKYGNETKAIYSAKTINRIIYEIINKNFNNDKPKNRCFISVIGYADDVQEICSGLLSDLHANPIRKEKVKQQMPDGNGGIINVERTQPIWVDPVADGLTNMSKAIELAKEIAEAWIQKQPESPAPVVINISDGLPYTGSGNEINETISSAKNLMNVSSLDGNVLLFNCHIEQNGANLIFPTNTSALRSDHAKFLFEISSIIPNEYKSAADKMELKVDQNARGCIFEADEISLIKLINFGSSKGLGIDKVN